MKYFVFLLVLITSVLAEEKHPIDIQMEKEMTKDYSNGGQIQSLAKAQKLWDKELNKHYKTLMTALDSAAKKKLQESQRAWITYRDKETENLAEFYGGFGGSMYRLFYANAVMELTRRRALTLFYFAGSLPERTRE